MSARRQLLRSSSQLSAALRNSAPKVAARTTPLLARSSAKAARAFSTTSSNGFYALRALQPATLKDVRLYSSKSFPSHTVINMPALSPTMTQGNIGAWSKKVGDSIAPGEVLVEIETDKAQMDFEFQEEGYIAKILTDTNAKEVAVGSPIAVLVEDADDVAAFEEFTAEDAGGAAAPAAKEEAAPAAEEESSAAKADAPKSESKSSSSDDRIKASPIAQKIANERGINLSQVKGTGPDGRIVKEDVENFKPAAAKPATTAASKPLPANAPTTAAGPAYTDVPTSNMRRVIANRLLESKTTMPHYYLTSEVNMEKINKLREVLNASSNNEYKLSVNDFIIKASALALKKVPDVNASWQGDFIRQYHNSDISVAVSTPAGLITPIVGSAESKGLADISKQVKEMAGRARENKLQPHEYQGGSFSISNLGMFGIQHFQAIMQPGQSAILAVGSTIKRVVPDETKETGFSAQAVMEVTLSADHRVIDGAVGAQWLQAFKSYMENPLKMLL
ncbi:pyruvate dehydrogenase complex dihydrolipoamide acetyltransferase component (E2) [Umbelopsis sp. WA50703]